MSETGMTQIDAIRGYVDAMFSALPKTKDIVEMKLQIIEHMLDQYEALVADGKNENESLGIVISEFGSVEEIKREFGIPDAGALPAADPLPPPDPELERLGQELRAFQPTAHLMRAVAIALFILAPFAAFVTEWPMTLFLFVAAGVGLLIYSGGRLGDYRELLREREAQLGITPPPLAEEAEPYPGAGRRRRAFYGLLPLAASILYLIMGFSWDLWHPGWIVFLFVPLVIGILELVRSDEDKGGQ